MLFLSKLASKLFLLSTMTSVTESNSKQNCAAKPLPFNQATFSIIDNSGNILATITNLDQNIDTKIINMDSNKFYDYLAYFPIPFDL